MSAAEGNPLAVESQRNEMMLHIPDENGGGDNQRNGQACIQIFIPEFGPVKADQINAHAQPQKQAVNLTHDTQAREEAEQDPICPMLVWIPTRVTILISCSIAASQKIIWGLSGNI